MRSPAPEPATPEPAPREPDARKAETRERGSGRLPPFPKRTLWVAGALLVVNLGGAQLLDALGLVEGLLSPGGGRLALLLPLAVVFYGARLFLLFAAPGLVAGALLLWAVDRGDRA